MRITKIQFLVIAACFLLSQLVIFKRSLESEAESDPLNSCKLKEFYPGRHTAKILVLDEQNITKSLPPNDKGRPQFDYASQSKEDPIVSVITPFRNVEIFTAADCVLQQSLQQIEWIIVNDESTKYLEKLEPYRNTSRVKVIDLAANKKLPGARNVGIKAAKAPFIFFLDADDMIEPTYV